MIDGEIKGHIDIKGTIYNIVYYLDEDHEKTSNVEEACFLLLQKPEDSRSDGIKQAYSTVRIVKGSLVKELSN